MMFSALSIIVVLAAAFPAASPIPASGAELQVQGADRIEEVTCAGKNDQKTLGRGNVRAAFDELHMRMNGPQVIDNKGNPFPGVLNVSDNEKSSLAQVFRLPQWSGCQPGQADAEYLQFPISIKQERVPKYEGGAVGRDRVLALVRGKSSHDYKNPLFCGAITIRGSDKKVDAFDPCSQQLSPWPQQASPGMAPQQMSPGVGPQLPTPGQRIKPVMIQ